MPKDRSLSLIIIAIVVACAPEASWAMALHPTAPSCEARLASNAYNTAFLRVTEDALLKGLLTASDLELALTIGINTAAGTIANPLAGKTLDEKIKPRFDAYKSLLDSNKLDLQSLRPLLQKLIADTRAIENKKNQIAQTAEVKNIFMPKVTERVKTGYQHIDLYETSKGPIVIATSSAEGAKIYFLNDVKNPVTVNANDPRGHRPIEYIKTAKGREVLVFINDSKFYILNFSDLQNLKQNMLRPYFRSNFETDNFSYGIDSAGAAVLVVSKDDRKTKVLIDLDTDRRLTVSDEHSVKSKIDDGECILIQITNAHRPRLTTFDALYADKEKFKPSHSKKEKLQAKFVYDTIENQYGEKNIIYSSDLYTTYISDGKNPPVKLKKIDEFEMRPKYFTAQDGHRIALVKYRSNSSYDFLPITRIDLDNPEMQTELKGTEDIIAARTVVNDEGKIFILTRNTALRDSIYDVAADAWIQKNLKSATKDLQVIKRFNGKQFLPVAITTSTISLAEINSSGNVLDFSLPDEVSPHFELLKYFRTETGREFIVVSGKDKDADGFHLYLFDINTKAVTVLSDVTEQTVDATYFKHQGREKLFLPTEGNFLRHFFTVDLFAEGNHVKIP